MSPTHGPLRRPLPHAAALLTLVTVLSGCGGSAPLATPSASPAAAPPESPTEQLHGRVAAAKDSRYVARYTLRTKGRPDRTVTVQLAEDGTWRIDVPGGAHGGTRDVAIAATRRGVYQCRLGGSAGCVKVAAAGKPVPAAYDPRVQHPFTDWLDVLSDPGAALSVERDATFQVPSGECFSVEPNAAALVPPMDAGIYCFDTNGILTGARFAGRTLLIAGATGKPPATVELPGPVIEGRGLSTKSPPPPPSPSASPTPSAGRTA